MSTRDLERSEPFVELALARQAGAERHERRRLGERRLGCPGRGDSLVGVVDRAGVVARQHLHRGEHRQRVGPLPARWIGRDKGDRVLERFDRSREHHVGESLALLLEQPGRIERCRGGVGLGQRRLAERQRPEQLAGVLGDVGRGLEHGDPRPGDVFGVGTCGQSSSIRSYMLSASPRPLPGSTRGFPRPAERLDEVMRAVPVVSQLHRPRRGVEIGPALHGGRRSVDAVTFARRGAGRRGSLRGAGRGGSGSRGRRRRGAGRRQLPGWLRRARRRSTR